MTVPDWGRRMLGVSFTPPEEFCPNGLSDLLPYVQLAEELGFGQFAVGDHVVITENRENYPPEANRKGWPYAPNSYWPEPLTFLAAVAGATRRIRLGTSVLIAPLRPAVLLAKTAATLDSVSGGRLDLALGTGWQQEEFRALGAPWEGRTARLEDTVGACRALWTGSHGTFHSETVSFDQLWCLPPPARPGGPIVLLAGPAKPVAARRVARLGDGWAPFPIGPEAARVGIAVMREAYKEAGRDPDTLRVRVSVNGSDEEGRVDVEAAFDKVRGLWDAGVQMVAMVAPSFLDDRRDLRDFLRHAADRLLRADRSAVPDG
jgi:probable F420-dependent oxidoreductase